MRNGANAWDAETYVNQVDDADDNIDIYDFHVADAVGDPNPDNADLYLEDVDSDAAEFCEDPYAAGGIEDK